MEIREILVHEGLAREEKAVAEDMIFDYSNRGGLGGNAHDAHRNAELILSNWADPQELAKATSMEVCPIGRLREQQYEFMRRLVRRSQGLFADVKGTETSGTLACGHFSQFVKACKACCKTPLKRLQDSSGRLNAGVLGNKNKNFGAMCREGWVHLKLSFRCRVAWPRLADLVQRALNASNTVPTHTTEVETIKSISEYGSAMEVSLQTLTPNENKHSTLLIEQQRQPEQIQQHDINRFQTSRRQQRLSLGLRCAPRTSKLAAISVWRTVAGKAPRA